MCKPFCKWPHAGQKVCLCRLLPLTFISGQELSKNSVVFDKQIILFQTLSSQAFMALHLLRSTYEKWQMIKRAEGHWGSLKEERQSLQGRVIWKNKTKITWIRGQSNLIFLLHLVANKSPLWCVAPESGTSKMRCYHHLPWPWKCYNKRSLSFRWVVCECAHVRGRMCRGTPSPLSARKIESAGRMSVPRLKSSAAISSHSSPLHLPQVALSSSQSTVCLLSYPIIMNMDVSIEPLGSNGWNREKQLSAVLMSLNIVIAVLGLCICMTCFLS